jgi:uncharacterized OB-fold protein
MYRNWYDDEFWRLADEGEFRLQRCSVCSTVVFPAGPVCPECLSSDLAWSLMSGRGRVYSWVRFHRQYYAELPPPYVCASVELSEGPLFITALQGFREVTLKTIGAPVQIRMVRFDNMTLPIAFPMDDRSSAEE